MKRASTVGLILILILKINVGLAQDSTFMKVNVGLGLGIDYGGIGARLTYLHKKYFSLFGAVGYNLVGVGANVGALLRISPNKMACPFIGAMYGYNAAILVKGADQYNETYYGPSFNLGVEVHSAKKIDNYFNVEVVIPIRSDDYKVDSRNLLNNPSIQISKLPLSLYLSVGWHIALRIRKYDK